MTAAEREAFRAEVRAYLLEDPEVLMEAIAVLEDRRAADAQAEDLRLLEEYHAAIFEDPASWSGGNPEGDVTVVEFVDYRCGYCRRAHDEVAQLLETDGNIRLVIKEFPILGEASLTSSRFAVATLQVAGPEAYKRVHDELIARRGERAPEARARLAAALGLSSAAIIARMAAPEVTAVIEANRRLAGTLQITGTPTFVINRTMVRGYVPLDAMLQIVDGQRG
ncbi:MAG TPA: DsbA family protein [Paracoccaceae bacterium]|nr:DsbA family protein [Paracoccaceae bacterium]